MSGTDREQGLTGLKVIEVARGMAAASAGKALADLGATVLKIEPPEGDPLRHWGPFPESRPDPEASALFAAMHAGKRGTVLDLVQPAGQERLAELAARADILVQDHAPASMAAHGLEYARLSAAHPGLVMLSITPFGLTGPHRDFAACELTLLHSGGWGWLSPGGLRDAALPPLKPFGQHASIQAGIHGAVAALAAQYGARTQGRGEHIDLSVQEVVAGMLEMNFVKFSYQGQVATRLGTHILAPWGFYPCRDGKILICVIEEDQWQRLIRMMGDPEWTKLEVFADTYSRGENGDFLDMNVAQWTADWNAMELFHALQRNRICAAPAFTYGQLSEEPHLRAREFWIEHEHPRLGRMRLPGAPWRLKRSWWGLRAPAPELGEADGEQVFPAPASAHRALPSACNAESATLAGGERADGAGARDAASDTASATAARPRAARSGSSAARSGSNGAMPPLPLAGVRVLDLSWVWAGPYCTMHLAHLGAAVIKIESALRSDLGRRFRIYPEGMAEGLNRSGYFNQWGQGKKSVAVNLSKPGGTELVKRLAAECDVVVDNFATGVLERLGLTAEAFHAVKPELIVASISGYGKTGPLARYMGYGPSIPPLGGLTSITGYADGDPREIGISYGDPNGGIHAALAIVAALWSRRRYGGGQAIEGSLWEAMLAVGQEGWAGHLMHAGYHPAGNRDPRWAPHNLFRCAGSDAWVAIACTDEVQWRALCAALECTALAGEARFRDVAARKANEDALDALIAAWVAPQERWAVTRRLQAAGVPAFPSLSAKDLVEDKHLNAREYFSRLPHPEVGVRVHTGIPWRLAHRPNGVRGAAPLLGAHTDEVLGDVLGMKADEIARLRQDGVLE